MAWRDLGCSDSYNVLYRSWYGVDSPCKQEQLKLDLERAGMSTTQAAQTVAEHQQQMKTTAIASDPLCKALPELCGITRWILLAVAVYVGLQLLPFLKKK